MKKIFTILLVLISINGFSQMDYGLGYGLDFGLKFTETPTFKINPYENSTLNFSSSLDLFIKIPLKNKISIYPVLIFCVGGATTSLENSFGKNMPEGYTVKIPYSTVGHGWSPDYYSKEYKYYLSDGNISPICLGGFVTKEFAKDFEFGTGLFFKIVTTEIKNYTAIDSYYWSSSTGSQWDNYTYSSTDVMYSTPEIITTQKIQLAFPILLQYTLRFDKFFMGYSLITYIGTNTTYSMRLTMGLSD